MVASKINSDSKKIKYKYVWLYFLFSATAFLASLWCLLWFFSSSSLASGFCNNQFSLFHEHFRCRQPYIAFIFFVVLGLTSLMLLVIGFRRCKAKP
jgi:hypothetical protein